jgi:hypothetical protein
LSPLSEHVLPLGWAALVGTLVFLVADVLAFAEIRRLWRLLTGEDRRSVDAAAHEIDLGTADWHYVLPTATDAPRLASPPSVLEARSMGPSRPYRDAGSTTFHGSAFEARRELHRSLYIDLAAVLATVGYLLVKTGVVERVLANGNAGGP